MRRDRLIDAGLGGGLVAVAAATAALVGRARTRKLDRRFAEVPLPLEVNVLPTEDGTHLATVRFGEGNVLVLTLPDHIAAAGSLAIFSWICEQTAERVSRTASPTAPE